MRVALAGPRSRHPGTSRGICHCSSHPTQSIGESGHTDRLEELRAVKTVPKCTGTPLNEDRLIPDRLAREGNQQPLDRIQLGGVEMRQDLG